MVRTHPDARFTLKTLVEIRDSRDILLQIEKTGSMQAETKAEIYLCEVVPLHRYNPSSTTERLTDEIVRVNTENRRLLKKIERLEKELRRNVQK